ncbi:MAG: hypothetical protein ACTSQJ_16170 [Promethearchaeota archaeon]
MSEEQQIKLMFEKFASKFEETVFSLIAKFNEISDGFNRVQEALDFLGKIRIQTAENKQLMTKMDKAFKNLERKLRDMSVDGFIIPGPSEERLKAAEEADDLSALLSAPVISNEVKEKVNDLSEFGDESQLPSLDEIVNKKEKPLKESERISVSEPTPTSAPEPAPEPAPISVPEPAPEPAPISVPEPAPEPAPISVPEPAPEPAPTSIPEPAPEPAPTSAPEPTLANSLESKPTLTPVPKLESKPALTPVPESPITDKSSESISIIESQTKITNDSGLTPRPEPPKPKIEHTAIEPQITPQQTTAGQRILNLRGPQDIWHNLAIDISESQTNEQIALSLGLANDNLKRFIRFHKVLFEILKTASEFRRKGMQTPPSNEDKAILLSKIENWKFELR